MNWPFIIFLTVASSLVVAMEIARRRRLSPMLNRASADRDWRRAFPEAPAREIRAFLELFVDVFALQRKHYLAFRPADRIMDVYRAINPPKWTAADNMELELLAQMLKQQYGLSLESIWRDDLTLGEVFGRTRAG
jgi:propanediol dehydratase small subunit